MQSDRYRYQDEIAKRLRISDTNKSVQNLGCIFPIKPPKNGGNLHYWAVIRKTRNNKPKILLKKQIGYKASQDGEIHDICFVEETTKNTFNCIKEKYNIIAKLSPASVDAVAYKNDLRFHPWKELFITKICSDAVKSRGITPHFSLYYGAFLCDRADKSMFKNVNIIRRLNNKAVTTELKKLIVDIGNRIEELDTNEDTLDILRNKQKALDDSITKINKSDYGAGVLCIIMERGDQDLSHYIDNKSFINTREIEILSFQILQSLICLHEFAGVIHLDLHLYNILVSTTKTKFDNKGVYRTYKIFSETFYVENAEIDIRIIDFGRSEFLNLMTAEELATEAKLQYNFLFEPSKSQVFYNNVKYNLEKNKKFYREFFKSFDVYRVFSELHASCKDIIDPDAEKLLKNIIRDSKNDFVTNFVDHKLKNDKKYEYQGHPYNILKKYFVEFDTFSENYGLTNPSGWYKELSVNDTDYIISKDVIKEYYNNAIKPIFTKYNVLKTS